MLGADGEGERNGFGLGGDGRGAGGRERLEDEARRARDLPVIPLRVRLSCVASAGRRRGVCRSRQSPPSRTIAEPG